MVSRRRLYFFGLVTGLALFAYQAWRAFLATQTTDYCVSQPRLLGLTTLIYILCTLLQIAAWYVSMHYLDIRIPVLPGIRGYVLSFLPRYVPGTVWGYLSRSEWLAQAYQVPYSTSTAASLLEVFLQLSTVLTLAALYWTPAPLRWGAGMIAFMVAITIWLLFPKFLQRLPSNRLRYHGKTRLPVTSFLIAFTLYLLFWSLHGTALVTLSTSFCQPVALEWWPATAAMGIAWAIGFLTIITPTGLGVRELSLSALLVSDAGILSGPASIMSVLARGLLLLAEFVMIAALYLATAGRQHRQ